MARFGSAQNVIVGLLMVAIVALAGGCSFDEDPPPIGVRLLSIADASEILLENPPDDLIVIDLRTPAEFAEARLPGAINIDFTADDFKDRLRALDTDAQYLIYDSLGNQSREARGTMADLGFTNVGDVDGGINLWVLAEEPIET